MNFPLSEPANFADFAYICPANDGPDAFSPEECEALIQTADSLPERPGTVSAEGVVDTGIRTVEVVDVSDEVAPDFYSKLAYLAASVNAFWWKFDLTELSNVEVLRYQEGGHYDEHVDRFGGFQTRKLTSITFLSDKGSYQGGDLLLRTSQGIVQTPKDQGTTVFFPSWLPHQVTPVTAGERRVASAWFRGPAFR